MALKITITDAGRAALINANKSGTRAVSIAAVGVSATVITANKLATNLPDEIKRITTISGEVTASDAIHLTAKDDGDSVYTVRSFALYLDDGTLFAIYGQPSPILEKSAAAMLLLQLDIRFVDIDATQIQFGNLDFINPAATEKTAGVTRLTALGEAEQSNENIAVSPVELRRFAEKLARQADMLAALATKFDKSGGVVNGTTSINDGILQLNKSRSGLWNTLNFATGGAMRWSVVADDEAETGKDAGSDFHVTRILDNGQQIFALNISRATGLVDVPASFQVGGVRPYSPHNDGEGSGLNAEYWRGLAPDYFTPQASTDALVNNLNSLINRRLYGDYGVINGGKRGFAAYNYNGRVAFCSKNADGSDDWAWLPNAIEIQQLSDNISALLAQKFDKAGGVINGTTSINDGILQLNKSRSGLWNTINFATGGAMRWSVVADDAAETGNDAGSNFHITRILDNGQQIFAFNISRATGLVDVPASFQIGGVRPYSPHNDGEGSGLNAEYWRGLAPDYFTPQSSTDALVNSLNNFINRRLYGDYGVINGGNRGFAAYRTSDGRVAFCSKNADGSDDWVLLPNTIELQNLFATISALLAQKFDKSGGVINGTTSINDGILQLNKSRSGLWNTINFATGGAMRWSIVADDAAETGNNAGSDFHITRILDNGQQKFALNISRATGLVDVPASFQVGGVRPYSPHNDGEGSGLNAEYWRGLAPDYFVANSRIETSTVPNGLMKRVDDQVELHLKLDNVVGVIALPHTFNNIFDIQITTFRDGDSRPVWANVISHTNNSIFISGNYMAHGNNQNADSCAGFVHVYGN